MGLRDCIGQSLRALKIDKIDLFYLHAPDKRVPFEETCDAINKMHKEGLFDRFGLSNFAAWEVAQVYTYCRDKGYILPTVYQGMYNAFTRDVEKELFPALKKYNMSFYAYNPLIGGLFSGRYNKQNRDGDHEGRFTQNSPLGQMYRNRYWNDIYFTALSKIDPVLKKEGLSHIETAIRWLMHHSGLKADAGDAIIIGASSLKHLEENLQDFEKGPLPDSIVEALEEAWHIVKPNCPSYFR